MMNLFPANLSMLDNMKVPEIRSLLSLKLMMAQEKGLIVQLHFPEPIELDTKHTVNLVRMLGIILDNAIEGASAAKKKNRIDHTQEESFRDDSCDQYNNKYITVKPVETKRVLNKNKSKNEGLGLFILDELTKTNPYLFLETSIENQRFSQTIYIQIK